MAGPLAKAPDAAAGLLGRATDARPAEATI